MLLFFFQAEDGIRDGHVTGVQTCALPISPGRMHRSGNTPTSPTPNSGKNSTLLPAGRANGRRAGGLSRLLLAGWCPEIGRASCRERVWIVVGVGGLAMNMKRCSEDEES